MILYQVFIVGSSTFKMLLSVFRDFAPHANIPGGRKAEGGCTGFVMIVLLPGDLIQAAVVDFLVDKGFAGTQDFVTHQQQQQQHQQQQQQQQQLT